jgi:uncharacterized membrane protein YkoI
MKGNWAMIAVALLIGVGLVSPLRAQVPPQTAQQAPPQTTQQGDAQDPKYACSVTVPKNTSKAQLAALAKINLKQAEAAANAAVAGNVVGAKLEDENSCLVYSVQITGTDGKLHDVKVDAGNGKVVHQEIAGENEQEGEED